MNFSSKKIMYMFMNSSFDTSEIKSFYAKVLREIALGLGSLCDDFTYMESAVLARHRFRRRISLNYMFSILLLLK
jgi:hypothetical protein